MPKLAASLAIVGCAVGPVQAQRKGIHIGSGRSVSFNWYLNDGAGYRWDISSNGQVSDGSNDAYDGGMQLRLGGSYFSSSSQGRLATDGREVEIGPWKRNNVQVYRRIYIDPKLGYCRWIDIFENPGSSVQSIAVQYYTNLGGSVQATFSTTGKPTVTDKDWGVVTGSTESSSRPAVVHIFASKGARVKPRFRYTQNSDSVYYDFALKVPPGKAVATCVFQAQRRPLQQAKKLLADFKPRREMAKVPGELRRIIVNMGGATLVLGNIDLPRHEKHDLAVLRNENELLGKILNERFDVETFYGRLELPAQRVVGISIPAPDDPHVQVVLVDGQVVAGTLANAPLRMGLTNKDEMSLPPAKLAAATFALSPERPGEIKLTRPTIVLRSGQQLYFKEDDLDCTYQTQYGTLKLDADNLRSIHFDTPEGGLHRANFRNGSVLSGLLTAEALKLRLDLGPTLTIQRHLASRCLLPSEEIDNSELTELTLRNDDLLFGHIDDESLTVATQYGRVTVKPSQIAELQIPEGGALGQVLIKLHDGTKVTGRFVGETVGFQMDPGPKLPVFLGHVVHLTCPKPKSATPPPEEKATDKPTTQPRPEPGPAGAPPPPRTTPVPPVLRTRTMTPATTPEKLEAVAAEAAKDRKKLAAARVEIKKLEEIYAQLQAQAKALAAQRAADARKAEPKRLAESDKRLAAIQARVAAIGKVLAAMKAKAPS